MGKFHHSKKHHGDKKKSSSSRPRYDLTQAGRKKLPEDFLYYTQKHKSIWNFFSNFLDERFAEEDLSEFLNEDEVTRIKTTSTIPPMLQFEPQTPGEVDKAGEGSRTITRRQVLLCRERGTVFRRNQEAGSKI
jgi:hypothetical protein